MNWPAVRDYLIERSREPSTWRGLILCVTACGVALTPEQGEAITALGLLMAGVLGAATKG